MNFRQFNLIWPAVPVSTLMLPMASMALRKLVAKVLKLELAVTSPEVDGSVSSTWSDVRSPLLAFKLV